MPILKPVVYLGPITVTAVTYSTAKDLTMPGTEPKMLDKVAEETQTTAEKEMNERVGMNQTKTTETKKVRT